MKIWKDRRSGFTLVELLVVIAIISLVAMATFSAVKGARRQANATKCQANMKNLHTAVVAYFADKQYYPPASSYEVYRKELSKNGKKESWYERQGWVSWIPSAKGSSRRNGDRKTPWQENSGKSHASKFMYPQNTDDRMKDAISEGAIYKYAGKNHETYKCPECPDAHLAFAMNKWFHCQYDRAFDLRTIGGMKYLEPSKMVLFIEIGGEKSSGSGLVDDSNKGDRMGVDGQSNAKSDHWPDDACWDWDNTILGQSSTPETGNFIHRKGGHLYSHVVFLDGHVASISADYNDFNAEYDPIAKASKIEDVFLKLGRGSYE